MYHPTRGGLRGGRNQFTWEDMKADKHRENYLGHSIKAPVGRWQKVLQLHKTEDGTQEYAEFLHIPRRRFTDFAAVRKK